LGIFARNREEWACLDLACARSTVCIVPFYDSLGLDALGSVINLTEVTTMCIEMLNFEKLLSIKGKIPTLKNIVIFDALKEDTKTKGEAADIKVFHYSEVL
jgi:long-subunit acyl-CoA synthetase (AMP-forming)